MPGPRLPMRRIRDVLRLSAAGMSKRQIAASLGVSATGAGECIWRARRAGLAWPLPEELGDEELERRLYPPPTAAKDRRPRPDWAAIHKIKASEETNSTSSPVATAAADGKSAKGAKNETQIQPSGRPRGSQLATSRWIGARGDLLLTTRTASTALDAERKH
jgi:hypothetical protein